MAKPLHYSQIPVSMRERELIETYGGFGATMLQFEPMPVQREIWNLLESKKESESDSDSPEALLLPLYEMSAIEVPRRAGKTEALFCEAIGRCIGIKDYQITYCAQTGQKSRERFYGLINRLHRTVGKNKGYRARESRGEERIEFLTGSVLRFLPPKASSFRGDAQDWVILDEAQETEEDDAADLIGSLMPVFDTREAGQLTVAGTAGAFRGGLLWDALEKGRSGTWGVLEYAAGPNIDPDNPEHWLQVHPGPAGVSAARALEVLTKRHAEMTPEMFNREYLGIWPIVTSQNAFDLDMWAKLGREMSPDIPERVGFAYDVAPGGTHSAVMAFWRNGSEVWVEVVREGVGRNWVAPFVAALGMKYRVPVGYDTAGIDTLSVADEIVKKFGKKVNLRGLTTIEFATACASFYKEVIEGTLRHSRQPALDEAIRNASRRTIRDAGWAWGRKQSTASICTLVAGTVALKMFDELPAPRSVRVLTPRSA